MIEKPSHRAATGVQRAGCSAPRIRTHHLPLHSVEDGKVLARVAVVGGVVAARLVARLAEARLPEEQRATLGQLRCREVGSGR